MRCSKSKWKISALKTHLATALSELTESEIADCQKFKTFGALSVQFDQAWIKCTQCFFIKFYVNFAIVERSVHDLINDACNDRKWIFKRFMTKLIIWECAGFWMQERRSSSAPSMLLEDCFRHRRMRNRLVELRSKFCAFQQITESKNSPFVCLFPVDDCPITNNRTSANLKSISTTLLQMIFVTAHLYVPFRSHTKSLFWFYLERPE